MATILLFATGVLSVLTGPVAANQAELERALAELRASDAEWRRERDLYRAQREAGQVTGAEAAEYAEFVAGLQRQKLENCENVRRIGGDDALKGTDCILLVASGAGTTQQAALPEPASTDAEKEESLDQQLKTLEAELDKELSGAQQRGKERAAGRVARLPGRESVGEGKSRAETNGEGAGKPAAAPKWSDPGPEKEGDGKDAGDAKDADADSKSKEAGDQTGSDRETASDPGAGGVGEEKEKAAKADNSAGERGDDDDVVLRQIREAAEKETDPVLKEKLWEEYRKMKAARS